MEISRHHPVFGLESLLGVAHALTLLPVPLPQERAHFDGGAVLPCGSGEALLGQRDIGRPGDCRIPADGHGLRAAVDLCHCPPGEARCVLHWPGAPLAGHDGIPVRPHHRGLLCRQGCAGIRVEVTLSFGRVFEAARPVLSGVTCKRRVRTNCALVHWRMRTTTGHAMDLRVRPLKPSSCCLRHAGLRLRSGSHDCDGHGQRPVPGKRKRTVPFTM